MSQMLSRSNSQLSKSAPGLLLPSTSHSQTTEGPLLASTTNSPPSIPRLEPRNTDLYGAGNCLDGEDELNLFIHRVDTLPVGTETPLLTLALTCHPSSNGLLHSPATTLETLTRSDFLANFTAQPDADHYSRDKVNHRLMEYLAVVRLREEKTEQAKVQEVTLKKAIDDPAAGGNEADGQIENACRALVTADVIPALPQIPVPVSPPQSLLKATKGIKAAFCCTGKTSLSQSIACALGRAFQFIAFDGMWPCERLVVWTYFPDFTGKDEIDKVGQLNYHGGPSAGLLEVLDPEKMSPLTFDRNLNVPIDLSQILFICTASSLDTISPLLLDRCEVIQLSGYTHDE
ncbi:hypothetical protein EDB87DRAFT_1833495 [Lactarius vividus]|nr:hypothetical protein EDB87DRAFT_1833495 [Lactarius vividus]